MCVLLKDNGERGGERQARKFATASCHGQPASFASRSYQSVRDCTRCRRCVGVRDAVNKDLLCSPSLNNVGVAEEDLVVRYFGKIGDGIPRKKDSNFDETREMSLTSLACGEIFRFSLCN